MNHTSDKDRRNLSKLSLSHSRSSSLGRNWKPGLWKSRSGSGSDSDGFGESLGDDEKEHDMSRYNSPSSNSISSSSSSNAKIAYSTFLSRGYFTLPSEPPVSWSMATKPKVTHLKQTFSPSTPTATTENLHLSRSRLVSPPSYRSVSSTRSTLSTLSGPSSFKSFEELHSYPSITDSFEKEVEIFPLPPPSLDLWTNRSLTTTPIPCQATNNTISSSSKYLQYGIDPQNKSEKIVSCSYNTRDNSERLKRTPRVVYESNDVDNGRLRNLKSDSEIEEDSKDTEIPEGTRVSPSSIAWHRIDAGNKKSSKIDTWRRSIPSRLSSEWRERKRDRLNQIELKKKQVLGKAMINLKGYTVVAVVSNMMMLYNAAPIAQSFLEVISAVGIVLLECYVICKIALHKDSPQMGVYTSIFILFIVKQMAGTCDNNRNLQRLGHAVIRLLVSLWLLSLSVWSMKEHELVFAALEEKELNVEGDYLRGTVIGFTDQCANMLHVVEYLACIVTYKLIRFPEKYSRKMDGLRWNKSNETSWLDNQLKMERRDIDSNEITSSPPVITFNGFSDFEHKVASEESEREETLEKTSDHNGQEDIAGANWEKANSQVRQRTLKKRPGAKTLRDEYFGSVSSRASLSRSCTRSNKSLRGGRINPPSQKFEEEEEDEQNINGDMDIVKHMSILMHQDEPLSGSPKYDEDEGGREMDMENVSPSTPILPLAPISRENQFDEDMQVDTDYSDEGEGQDQQVIEVPTAEDDTDDQGIRMRHGRDVVVIQENKELTSEFKDDQLEQSSSKRTSERTSLKSRWTGDRSWMVDDPDEEADETEYDTPYEPHWNKMTFVRMMDGRLVRKLSTIHSLSGPEEEEEF